MLSSLVGCPGLLHKHFTPASLYFFFLLFLTMYNILVLLSTRKRLMEACYSIPQTRQPRQHYKQRSLPCLSNYDVDGYGREKHRYTVVLRNTHSARVSCGKVGFNTWHLHLCDEGAGVNETAVPGSCAFATVIYYCDVTFLIISLYQLTQINGDTVFVFIKGSH